MRLDEVIRGIAITDRRGIHGAEIASITSDSRNVGPGDLFVAVRGYESDGHAFISDAVKSGASTVIGESWPAGADEAGKPNVVLVPNARRALALAASNYYGQPSRKLLIAGVTGTNGKTTVTYVLESIIRAASKKVGVIGSIGCRYVGTTETLDFTTPDSVVLQRKLAQMLEAKVSHVVMEVSSHALEQQRVTGTHFKVVGFTNLSQDHLDYHQTMESYFEAKARLFSEVLRKSRARGRMAVVNIDDPRGQDILDRWGGKALRTSMNPEGDADVVALETEYSLQGIKATVRTSKGVWEIESALIGKHNLANILTGIGMALAMGFSRARITRGIRALERVPGRLERIPNEEGKNVFVDYAHTPDALDHVLKSVRELTKGKLLVVFGCGGDRDQSKRAPMGAAVAAHADMAIVTNDNPRGENPDVIATAVAVGLKGGGFKAASGKLSDKSFAIELDRRAAIRVAIEQLGQDDALIIAGKGHETHQTIGKKRILFDDREEARRILAGMPPPPPVVFEDTTSEVETEQVIEAAEMIENAEILDSQTAPPKPVTEQVEAEEIVDAIDLEPEVISETASDSDDDDAIVEMVEVPDEDVEVIDVDDDIETAEDDDVEMIEATDVVEAEEEESSGGGDPPEDPKT